MPTLPNLITTNPNYWLIISNDGYKDRSGDLFRIEKRCIPQNKPNIQYIELQSIPDAENGFNPKPNSQQVVITYTNGEYDDFRADQLTIDGSEVLNISELFDLLINTL